MRLTKKLKTAIEVHAAACYPRECCGVIVGTEYLSCKNIATNQDQFEIDHVDLASAEDRGEILAYVHSHPDGSTAPSQVDLVQMAHHGKPWVICAYPDIDFAVHQPSDYKAPLIGRDYFHGLQDCYTIVKDFYSRELGIDLPEYERNDEWWTNANNPSLYLDNYKAAGFYQVDSPQYGDMLVCLVGRTEHPNHAAIYLGDNGELKSETSNPCVGSALILHHPYGRKSVREIYGQQWFERTVMVLRHAKNN